MILFHKKHGEKRYTGNNRDFYALIDDCTRSKRTNFKRMVNGRRNHGGGWANAEWHYAQQTIRGLEKHLGQCI
ncbi:hypothetical protein AB4345_05365 [Vibrio breoganii]